jgi:hypothetical protein
MKGIYKNIKKLGLTNELIASIVQGFQQHLVAI